MGDALPAMNVEVLRSTVFSLNPIRTSTPTPQNLLSLACLSVLLGTQDKHP